MQQDGKEVQVKEEGDRRIFYIDVGNMTAKKAKAFIKEMQDKVKNATDNNVS